MPRNRGAESVVVGKRVDQPLEVVRNVRRRPWCDRPLGQTLLVIGHHELRIDLHSSAQTGTLRARAPRTVERELAWLELLDCDVMIIRAGHALGVSAFAPGIGGIKIDKVD